MKLFLPIACVVVCIGLVIALVMTKNGDNAQHETDVSAINDFSNQLDSAHIRIATSLGTVLTFSNSLNECQAAALMFSNHLNEAQSTIALDAEQLTNLNQQIVSLKSENQAFAQRVMDLTNQVAGLTRQIAFTQASLTQTNQDLVQAYKDYSLLENRFRTDVAERTVVERKFNNLLEVQDQLQKLKKQPAGVVTAESIYAGLDVMVRSNGSFHVISSN